MKDKINLFLNDYKKYILYAFSIVFGRGLEYFVYFVIAYYLTKEAYGDFEFYKKIIEFFPAIISLGGAALILTYTKSKESKINFFVINTFIVSALILLALPVAYYFKESLLVLSLFYFSVFHYSNSTIQSYNLVMHGSAFASKYKIIVSVGFASILMSVFYLTGFDAKSLIYTGSILSVLFLFYFAYVLLKNKELLRNSKKYFVLYKNQTYNSLTLMLNTLVNQGFLVTDIFVLKFLSEVDANINISEYGFALLIANILLMVPQTISTVDIESYKYGIENFQASVKKNLLFILLGALVVTAFYFFAINTYFEKFSNTKILFLVIIVSKVIQSISIPYGNFIATRKKYFEMFNINLIAFIFNIVLSTGVFYYTQDIILVAVVSLFTLILRFSLFYKSYKKQIN